MIPDTELVQMNAAIKHRIDALAKNLLSLERVITLLRCEDRRQWGDLVVDMDVLLEHAEAEARSINKRLGCVSK